VSNPAIPDLNQWPEADDLLQRALDLPREQRRAFVKEAAAGDAGLEHALNTILAEDDHGRADDFLDPRRVLSGPLFDDLFTDSDQPPGATLAEGQTLGPYRVDRRIGRGGMGEVYRARDVRLGRDVALKILPQHLARDLDRVARFEREARALASVSHPGIGAIFDVYEQPGTVALVLELVDGPTLADRVAAGALGVDTVIAIARQLVDALEAAHEAGIVHRDLKPANVKIAADGAVKVLDFGLARAVSDDEGVAAAAALPTITTILYPGVVLGTAPYMSPEQARGHRVDHRADIWAFGCVLFEMLSGERAFTGDTTNDILAKVLERPPDLERLPPSTPQPLLRLIDRCLQKDARRRLGYIGDARHDLDEALADRVAKPPPRRTASRLKPARIVGALALVVGALALFSFVRLRPNPPRSVRQLAVPVPAGQEIVIGRVPSLELSRSGDVLVYRARENGVIRLFVRRLDELEAKAIPGTEDGTGHAVSPDGQWVAFGRDGQLLKALLSGGSPVVLAEAQGGLEVTWESNDSIIFSSGQTQSLFRVSDSGGKPEPLTRPDASRGERSHGSPTVSADGTIAFTIASDDRSVVAVTDRSGREITILTEGRQPRFLSDDLIVFARQYGLWAARYDSRRRALSSDPVPVLDGIERSTLTAQLQYALAGDGTLLYVPDSGDSKRESLIWRDRQGKEESVEIEGRGFVRFALSPDATRLALAVSENEDRDVWIFDRARKALSRLTFDRAAESAPVWSPDGASIAYRSDVDGGGVMLQAADGSGTPRRLTRAAAGTYHIPYAFTRDRKHVLFVEFRDYSDQNILMVSSDGAGRSESVLTGPAAETRPALSPDGRWMAYQSDESGRSEVYVRPWPDVSRAKWQVSTGGGTAPLWRRDGGELFFASSDGIMGAEVESSDGFRTGVPSRLFALEGPLDRFGALFDVSADGRQVLLVRANRSQPVAPGLRLVTHWDEVLRARLASINR
jgi:serine/threonine-protein kinase